MKRILLDPYVQQVSSLSKVKEFLDSYGVKKTHNTYRSSLVKFNSFLELKYNHNNNVSCDTIIDLILKKEVEVYELLRRYVAYLPTIREGITANTISIYIAAIRSFLEFYDVDTHKFKRKVKLPKIVNEKEQAIDKKDIYQLLISCHNKRLKSYILLLISSGLRADSEACTLRNCDVNLNTDPAELHIRGDFTKTKTTRTSYITPEAKKFLLEFIDFRGKTESEQLLFSSNDTDTPKTIKETQRKSTNIYLRLGYEFAKLLKTTGLDKRKEAGIVGKRRHCITFHSCRRFTSTVLEDIVGKGYHDFILGHNGNMYHTQKKEKIIEDYKRCIPYLTVLDVGALEASNKSIEARLEVKDQEITFLQQELRESKDAYIQSANMYQLLNERLEKLEKSKK